MASPRMPFTALRRRKLSVHRFGPQFYRAETMRRIFFLKHHNEPRGIGGFFDDFSELGFEESFALTRSVGKRRALVPATAGAHAFTLRHAVRRT